MCHKLLSHLSNPTSRQTGKPRGLSRATRPPDKHGPVRGTFLSGGKNRAHNFKN